MPSFSATRPIYWLFPSPHFPFPSITFFFFLFNLKRKTGRRGQKVRKRVEMGRLFVVSLEGKIYSCKHCGTHLALCEDVVSKVYTHTCVSLVWMINSLLFDQWFAVRFVQFFSCFLIVIRFLLIGLFDLRIFVIMMELIGRWTYLVVTLLLPWEGTGNI